MTAPTLRQLGDRVDEAYCAFLDGARDGDAFVAAYDTREQGYDLAVKGQWENDRDAFLEEALDALSEGPNSHTASLIASAFRFRLAELDAQPRQKVAA